MDDFDKEYIAEVILGIETDTLDLDKNAIQRIESGERFVTDIELVAIAEVLNTPVTELLFQHDN